MVARFHFDLLGNLDLKKLKSTQESSIWEYFCMTLTDGTREINFTGKKGNEGDWSPMSFQSEGACGFFFRGLLPTLYGKEGIFFVGKVRNGIRTSFPCVIWKQVGFTKADPRGIVPPSSGGPWYRARLKTRLGLDEDIKSSFRVFL